MTSALPPTPPPPEPPAPPQPPSGWQPPPPPPFPQPRPTLRRSRTDKVIGGVSGGLAEYSGIDALLWRVGFVALTLAGGSGIIVYLLLWLLMPAGRTAAGAELEVPREPVGPRSPVPGLTAAGVLIVVGIKVLVTRFTGWDLGPRGFLGSALLVVGLGLVAAAFTGGRRAKGALIALGVVLSVALIAATSVPWDHREDMDDRVYRPMNAESVQNRYDGGLGDVTLDLTGIDLNDLSGPVTTRIDSGVGNVDVLVPRSADVQLVARSGIGDLRIFDTGTADGGFFPGTGSATWTGDGRPEFRITIESGIGDVEVSRG